MAVARTTPTCPHCKKEIATAVCHTHYGTQFFGDTFSHWKYKKHSCAESVAYWKKFNASPKGRKMRKALKAVAKKMGWDKLKTK